MATPLDARWAALRGDGDGPDLDPGETLAAPTLVTPPEALGAPITLGSLPHIALTSPDLPDEADGDRADFDVTGVLGEGGQGRVLLARQRSLHREVAIKQIREEIDDDAVLRGLLTEALITGSLEHPGIVPVHALGRGDDGRPILVMKRVEGVSWRDLCRDPHHPGWARLDAAGDDRATSHLEILTQVCNALDFAHQRGIVHRDVKPANVMVGACGEVYVVDWGIATRIGAATDERDDLGLVGTPCFMAPEMVECDALRIDARTDVYLLGATLHHVLTGKPRHHGDTTYHVLLAASDSRPVRYGPEVPAELATICNKATSRDPDDRYPSALAFRRALADYRRHESAYALGQGAAAQLDELRAALAEPSPEPRRIHRLMTECRFGFMQALRGWPENVSALAGLGDCLALMIDHELALDNRDAAAALIAELPAPRPELANRLAALDAELLRRGERDARLRSLEREHDPSVNAGRRAGTFALVALGVTVVSAVVLWFGPRRVGHLESVGFMVLVDAVIAVGVVLERRRLWSTQAGRGGAGALVLWGATTLGHRLLGARFDTPVAQVITVDIWLITLCLTFGALVLPRGLGWSIAVSVVGAIAATVCPELASYVYLATGLAVCVTVGLYGYRLIKKP